jgi:hypothetical protein
MPCWIETSKSPEIDSAILLLSAKSDRFVKQPVSNALSLVFRYDDEPPQVGGLAIVMDPIDGNGANNLFFHPCYPKSITGFI